MNLKTSEGEQPYMTSSSALNHSKSKVDPASFIQKSTKTPTNNTSVRGLKNPIIIKEKFSLVQSSSRPKGVMSGESSNQTS